MVRVPHSRQEFHTRAASLLGLVVWAGLATGCKTGSWAAKPSWWSSAGTPPASSLTAAPSFDKDVAKPSETAKPYPTTNTPEGYALSETTNTDASRPNAGATAALVEPTSVTYGVTPPPAAAQPTPVAAPAAVAAAAVGPQVGPYASLQPQSATPPPPGSIDPAGAVTAGMAAAPAFGEATPPGGQVPPAQPFAAQPPGARYADATPSQSWAAAPPPAAPPATAANSPTPGLDNRYGEANGSRFAPVDSGLSAPPAAAFPAAPPAATPPAAGGEVLPGAITPPKRRADPGYRPGGTSSYRPGNTILAGDEPTGSGVVPASFEAAPTGE